MITKITNAIKDSGRMSLTLSLLFVAGILVSAYLLFTLPHNLVLRGGVPVPDLAWPVLTGPFVSIGLTFILAAAALLSTIRHRTEVVVYVEKKKDESRQTAEEAAAEEASVDIQAFKAGLKDIKQEDEVLQKGLNAVCQLVQAGQGAIYQLTQTDGKRSLVLKHGYAIATGEGTAPSFEWGEGLIGQAAASGKLIYLDEVPEGYINVLSGLGTASPRYLAIVPMKKGEQLVGVLEIATFKALPQAVLTHVREMVQVISEKTK